MVQIGDVAIRVGDSIDYKSATERLPSAGKVEKLQYAGYKQCDSESVWMLIRDIVNSNVSEWVSVYVWNCQRQRGMFKQQTKPSKPVEDASAKSVPTEDLPF